MRPEFVDPPPPFDVSMHVSIRFHHQVSMAENMDAATQMVQRQVEMFLNKAKAEDRKSVV